MIYFASTIRALESQIEDLRARLEKSEAERASLLDRLLQRNHFEPVTPAAAKPTPQNFVQVVAPFGVQLPEVQDGLRESWIAEEAQYLCNSHGYEVLQAQAEAAKRYDRGEVQFKVN